MRSRCPSSAFPATPFRRRLLSFCSGHRSWQPWLAPGNPALGLRWRAWFATIKGRPDLTRFVPSLCNFNALAGELPQVAPVPSQGSGDLISFSRSNCFLVVPEGTERLEAGSIVKILLS